MEKVMRYEVWNGEEMGSLEIYYYIYRGAAWNRYRKLKIAGFDKTQICEIPSGKRLDKTPDPT